MIRRPYLPLACSCEPPWRCCSAAYPVWHPLPTHNASGCQSGSLLSTTDTPAVLVLACDAPACLLPAAGSLPGTAAAAADPVPAPPADAVLPGRLCLCGSLARGQVVSQAPHHAVHHCTSAGHLPDTEIHRSVCVCQACAGSCWRPTAATLDLAPRPACSKTKLTMPAQTAKGNVRPVGSSALLFEINPVLATCLTSKFTGGAMLDQQCCKSWACQACYLGHTTACRPQHQQRKRPL